MKKKKNEKNASKFLITVLSAACVVTIAVSATSSSALSPVKKITGIVVTPMQKGINALGNWTNNLSGNLTDAQSLREANIELQSEVDALVAENSQLVLDKEELNRLRDLVELSEQYADYQTVGAHVISKGNGNWFSTFTIDKGSQDGIQVDCNVLAGSGLCGIVTEVGPNWATVRSIIDDDSNVSAMVSTTSDTCIIAGSLQLIDEGTMNMVQLTDDDNKVHVGDKVVTSNISEKFLPGILVGYITELGNDANNLTKSGKITPVVDFKHIQEVLVVKERKQYRAMAGSDSSPAVVDDINNPGAGETEG